MSSSNNSARRRYTPLSLLATEKQMSARKLLRLLQDAGVTCFRLGDSWQVAEDEYDAFQDRCASEARHAHENQ